MRRPWRDEKLPTTPASTAPIRANQVRLIRSTKATAAARDTRTRNQAIWNPQRVFPYCTTENERIATGQ